MFHLLAARQTLQYMAEVSAFAAWQDLWLWDDLFLSLSLGVQVSRSQLYFKLSNWRRNKEVFQTIFTNEARKNPLHSVFIQIGFCFVTSHRTQLDFLMSFMLIPVPLTSSVLCGIFLFFFEILVFPLFYGCYYSGSVDISDLQVFSSLNWVSGDKCVFFFFFFSSYFM